MDQVCDVHMYYQDYVVITAVIIDRLHFEYSCAQCKYNNSTITVLWSPHTGWTRQLFLLLFLGKQQQMCKEQFYRDQYLTNRLVMLSRNIDYATSKKNTILRHLLFSVMHHLNYKKRENSPCYLWQKSKLNSPNLLIYSEIRYFLKN